jgi:hypothetical protein
MPNIKLCRKCGMFKHLRAFAAQKKSRDGKQPYCKACMNAMSAQYRADPVNRERIRALAAKHNGRIKAERAAARAALGGA